MNKDTRLPQAFVFDEEVRPSKGTATRKRIKRPAIEFASEPADAAVVPVPQTAPLRSARRFRWLALFIAAVWALLMMWAGLALTQLVESFFARHVILGWIALAIAAIAGLAALAIIVREVAGLMRLNSLEELQDKAARAINLDDAKAAGDAVRELKRIYGGRPELHGSLAALRSHEQDIMDPKDRIRLAERLLLEPLDDQARKVIASRARRVTLLTTVTPAAALDILFVAAQNLSMLRDIATLYGGKPSTLATMRLARMVITHLAVTGGLALSDNLIQHLVGKGLLGRLSARFGEGAVNGILTSRIGLAAMNVCRPVPGDSTSGQSLASLLKEVLSLPQGASAKDTDADQKPQS